ncbi:hypothetical protein [Micromonospora sp. NPDC005206]|uniref:hypothetical protein n=1 Tax=Micromonospora sp. NPDC005206 TaxID=3157022 RepID=UPI00339F3579
MKRFGWSRRRRRRRICSACAAWGQPKLVRPVGGEVSFHEVVMHRRTDLATLAAPLALAEGTPPAIIRADLPRGALSHHLSGGAGLIDQEPVPELRVIAMGVHQGVRAVSGNEFGVADGPGEPPVVGLTSDVQYPARHRHGDPVGGQLAHERVEPFPGRFACDK